MDNQDKRATLSKGSAVAGTLLIASGMIYLLGMIFGVDLGQYIWPFLVIIAGAALFVGALGVEVETGKGLAMAGGIVTMVGTILLAQSLTGFWATWAYAWALVAPTAAGLGLWLYGSLKNQSDLVKTGQDLVRIGLVIFVIAAVFFELVIGINGYSLGSYGLPTLLILLGLFLLIRNVRNGWHSG